MSYKKAQLSLTNPRDACEKFARFTYSGVVSCIASLPIDGLPMVSYYVLHSNCVCKMRRFYRYSSFKTTVTLKRG